MVRNKLHYVKGKAKFGVREAQLPLAVLMRSDAKLLVHHGFS